MATGRPRIPRMYANTNTGKEKEITPLSEEVEALYAEIFGILISYTHKYFSEHIIRIVYEVSEKSFGVIIPKLKNTISISINNDGMVVIKGINKIEIDLNEPNSIEKMKEAILVYLGSGESYA